MAKEFEVKLNQKEFNDALDMLKKMHDSIDDKYLKSTLRRKAKPIERAMKTGSPSVSISKVIARTTSKKKVGNDPAVKVGVVKNDPDDFPTITSYALASIIERGTEERFRRVKTAGIITGEASTGKITKDSFLRPAWDNNIRSIEKSTIKTIVKRIERNT